MSTVTTVSSVPTVAMIFKICVLYIYIILGKYAHGHAFMVDIPLSIVSLGGRLGCIYMHVGLQRFHCMGNYMMQFCSIYTTSKSTFPILC